MATHLGPSSLPRYVPGPPCPARKQAHGHPSATLAVSVKTTTPGNGRTRPSETPGCCCGSCGCSCYGWPSAGSSVCCSRNRPESRAGYSRHPSKRCHPQAPLRNCRSSSLPPIPAHVAVHVVQTPGIGREATCRRSSTIIPTAAATSTVRPVAADGIPPTVLRRTARTHRILPLRLTRQTVTPAGPVVQPSQE